MTLKFFSTLNERATNESFGFKDLDIIYCSNDGVCESNEVVKPPTPVTPPPTPVYPTDSDFTKGLNILQLVRGDNIQNGWTSNIKLKDWTTVCDNNKILGGYNIGGKGAYFSRAIRIPRHKRITLSLRIYAIDSWYKEYFLLYGDGK